MGTRRLEGAIAGGLAAGLAITALLMAMERKTGTPSELAMLERAGLSRLGYRVPPAHQRPGPAEQLAVQGGHLVLSGLAGAAYAATISARARILPGGIGFGLAFYGLAHWILGPALRLKAPEWRADPATLGLHAANHVLFGLVTAVAARLADRRQQGGMFAAGGLRRPASVV